MSTPERLLPRWCDPAARVAAAAFGTVVRVRNARFDRGVGVHRLPVPVVSVGNIDVGGTGKSPLVRWIAREALALGCTPVIALRGYRSSDGHSDEAAEHRALVPEAAVAVGARRLEQVARALAADPALGCVILDDGFQHRRIARDLDLVLVDARGASVAGRLLPLGRLRESPASLSRAHGVIMTRARAVDAAVGERVRAVHGAPPLAWCDHHWSSFDVHTVEPGGKRSCVSMPLSWLQGQSVAVWAGIGRPADFAAQARAAGGEVVHQPRLRDHAHYGRRAVARLAQAARARHAQAVVMTLKDWVKAAPDLPVVGMPVVVPVLGLRFLAGEEKLRQLVGEALRRR